MLGLHAQKSAKQIPHTAMRKSDGLQIFKTLRVTTRNEMTVLFLRLKKVKSMEQKLRQIKTVLIIKAQLKKRKTEAYRNKFVTVHLKRLIKIINSRSKLILRVIGR